jgi:hypothetical protein
MISFKVSNDSSSSTEFASHFDPKTGSALIHSQVAVCLTVSPLDFYLRISKRYLPVC